LLPHFHLLRPHLTSVIPNAIKTLSGSRRGTAVFTTVAHLTTRILLQSTGAQKTGHGVMTTTAVCHISRTPPHPSCPRHWHWSDQSCSCERNHPKPSGKSKSKRVSEISLLPQHCPWGLRACPIAGFSGLTGDYECIDTTNDLESCGGCASLGEGEDCTAIYGGWNVGCVQGNCAIYTCASGFRRSIDGKSCAAI